MLNSFITILTDKTSADIKPDGVANGINYQSFSGFLGAMLGILFLLFIVVWGIMYSKVTKLREENEELTKELEKFKNTKSE